MLIKGDCLEEMKKIEDNKIDLLFCDLPFGCTSCKWDCILDLTLFWKEINRICKINCPMFFCCNAKFGNTLINSNPKNFRYDLIWSKSAPVGFLNAKRMPMKKHELIYVFYRKLPFYDLSSHNHKFLGERESNRKGKEKQTRNTPKLEEGYGKDYLKNKPNYRLINPNLGANGTDSHIYDPPLPHSILEIKSQKGKHATQKPVALIEWILKYYSKEGDTILDPTMGSGSSGVACNLLKRKYIGIEKDEEIFKIAVDRNK
jgi:site-specific DNA-methyltransferase (adenine-specific)